MNFKYRPEIDGLRAIAVFSVIIYHARFEIIFNDKVYKVLPGGFLGVDIFYVISGYLITYLILERIKINSFSFSDFYERRARRLLPTLFAVIAISVIAGWIFMMPGQLKEFSGSAISSLFFLSNFWFWLTDNYFAETSSLKPLLHTWSLSIEEQFYIIFPPFLYFLYKKKIKNIKILFITLIISSLLFANLGNIYFKNLNFYLLPSRIWELLIGAILAYYHVNEKETEKKKLSNFLSIIGIILILLPFFLFNDQTPHPSMFTLFTIIGTAVIIFYNKDFSLVKNILSTKIFVGFGLISYSLYLWHFPVFAFKEIKSSRLSEFDKLESIFLIIILSILSYYIIEKPFRNRKLILKKYFFTFISAFFILLLSTNYFIYKKDGLPDRYSPTILKLIEFNYDYKELYEVGKCHIENINFIEKNIFKNCFTEYKNSKKNIFLWGDSLAAHLYPGVKFKYQKTYNLWHRSVGACKPSVFNFNINIKKRDECARINKLIFDKIIDLKPDKIFLAGFWNKDDLTNLEKIINRLKNNGVSNIYLVGPAVRWHDPLPKILLKEYRISKKIPKYLYDENHPKNFKLDQTFNNFADLNSINYLSLIKILCKKNNKCLTKVGEEADSITNWDENHFTEKASKYIFSKFMD